METSPSVSSETTAIYRIRQWGSEHALEIYSSEPERVKGFLMKIRINWIQSFSGEFRSEVKILSSNFSDIFNFVKA